MFKRVIKYIIIILSFCIIWLGVLPLVLTNIVKVACTNVSYNSSYEIKLKNPQVRFSLLPTGTFKADEIIVSSKQKEFDIKIEKFKIKLRLLPLLSGRVHVNRAFADSLVMSANIANEVELDKDFFNKLEQTKFKFDSIVINKFDANLYQKQLEKPIIYKGKNFVLQLKNKYLRFKLNSSLDVAGRVSTVNINLFLPKNNDIKRTGFDIEVSTLDIAPLRLYLKHYLPKDLRAFQGFINVYANKGELVTELDRIAILYEDSNKSIVFPDKMQIKSKFNIKRQYIDFNNIDIESKNIHTSLNGRITDYFGKSMPTIDLNVRVNKSRVEDLVKLLPAFNAEEINTYCLKKYKFYGDMFANFSIKGRLPEPDLNGDIYVSNGILTKPIPNASSGASIKLNLLGRYVNYDIYVPAGANEKVWVKGGQELYNLKYADMTIKSTDSVDLKIAETVLNPLHEILNFIIGPVPIMDIYGKGNIDIQVKGNRKNPHIWGVFNAKNAKVNFNEIPALQLCDTEARLVFNDQDAVFNTKQGNVNGKEFKVNGVCNVFGKFDFNVESSEQPTEALYNAIRTSILLDDVQPILPSLDKISGLTDLKLKIYGSVKDINELKFNRNTFAKGEIKIKENDFTLQNLTVNNTNGIIYLDGLNTSADIQGSMSNAPFYIKTKVKNKIADLALSIPKLNPNFIIPDEETKNKQYLPYVSVDARYKGSIDIIDYDKLNLNAKVVESNPLSKIHFQSGELILANGKINIKNISGFLDNVKNTFYADLRISDLFKVKPVVNGEVKIKTPDLSLFNEILASNILPKSLKFDTKNYEFKKGAVDLVCKVINNKLSAYSELGGISFVYKPLGLPVDVINGAISIRNNTLKLNKINLLADKMPILIDGDIKNIFDKQNLNIYINSKPRQEFIEKYINKTRIYPIKIKGDIVYWAKIKGMPDNYELTVKADMSKDSSFYYQGATVGDIENAIVLTLDSKVLNQNAMRIKEFSYDKLIDSQSGKSTRLNMLKAWGGVEFLQEDLDFKDLHIKTSHPTDARIFNIIFRKPNIKQGQFTSDLKLNNKLSNPHVLGEFHIFETNIPFLDTSMKNIELNFKEKTIEISSKGDILGNAVSFDGIMKNKLTLPYHIERANLYTKDLNINNIVNKLKVAQVDNVSTFESLDGFDLSSIIADDFRLKADIVQLRNINATEFEAQTSINDKKVLDVNNFSFNIAKGSLSGKYKYNLKNNNMMLNLSAKDINANDITTALFDLNNQIYGDMTGNVNLSCNGTDFASCMKTLNGNSIFNVKDGRMPKLGSLEYLLKAGNLLKGGLTGLSINSVIDIITPLKTGEFSDIFGSITIIDGVARDIEIASKGKDLNLFITGMYNFATSHAEMEVLGLLSRKISTMFGPLGNMSINTLFSVIPGVDLSKDSVVLERINKIPGIELSNKTFRKFIAEIKGNINGDNYVTSFSWIN